MTVQRVSCIDAEPRRFAEELTAMAAVAPELDWHPESLTWAGVIPVWPFDRPQPAGLDGFLGGRRLLVNVVYSQAFPMVAPSVFPVDPEPDLRHRTDNRWHVNGDGSLCMFQSAAAWDGTGTASSLVIKAAGWFLEYLLMIDGVVEAMTESGVVSDASLDHLFVVPQIPSA